MRASTKASKDVIMPRWLWIVMPFALIGNPLLQVISHTGSNRIRQTIFTVLVALGIYGIFYWFAVRKKKKTRAFIGSKIDGVFRDETLDFSINGNTSTISYRLMTKIGRDERGLAMVLGSHGTLWFPTSSFLSFSHRDAVYEKLGSVLRKKK